MYLIGGLALLQGQRPKAKGQEEASEIAKNAMKILVMMKQVANKDAILRINKDATWIEEGDLSFEVSESDGYALEEALRVREKLGGEVVVCSMGPQRVKSVIKDALAPGAA